MTQQPQQDPVEMARTAQHAEVADADRRARRRVLPIAGGIAAGVALIVSGFALQAGIANTAAIDTLRVAAQEAKPAGDTANRELEERGQRPVPIPEPGQGSDTEVIVAATTARVMASIPDTTPSPAQLGEALVRYTATNPDALVGSVTASLAGYFAVNPPPSGPAGPSGTAGRDCDPTTIPECRGPQGEPGPDPPTAEQIRDEFIAYARANPDVMCPLGGTFSQLRLQLADGGQADTWTCVISVDPPASTTSSAPTTTESPPLLPILGG